MTSRCLDFFLTSHIRFKKRNEATHDTLISVDLDETQNDKNLVSSLRTYLFLWNILSFLKQSILRGRFNDLV